MLRPQFVESDQMNAGCEKTAHSRTVTGIRCPSACETTSLSSPPPSTSSSLPSQSAPSARCAFPSSGPAHLCSFSSKWKRSNLLSRCASQCPVSVGLLTLEHGDDSPDSRRLTPSPVCGEGWEGGRREWEGGGDGKGGGRRGGAGAVLLESLLVLFWCMEQ